MNFTKDKMNAKGTRYTQKEIDELARLYSSGSSVYKICKLLNRSETSVKNHLKKLGIFVPTELDISEFDTKDFDVRWWYIIFIPLYVLTPSANPVEILLVYIFG